MARWLCDVCDRTNSEGQTLCWCCGKERRAETVEDLRTALTAATERAERAESRLSEHDEARRRAYEALRGVMATEAGGLTGDPIVDAIGALRAALEEERLQHSHTAAAVEEYRDGFSRRMQEIATLRTRLIAAEAERDRYRSALRDVAREWPYLDLIDPQTAQECDLRGLVEYLLSAVRSEQRVAREALEGPSDA